MVRKGEGTLNKGRTFITDNTVYEIWGKIVENDSILIPKVCVKMQTTPTRERLKMLLKEGHILKPCYWLIVIGEA